jgi:hypothetical protein
MKFSLFRYEAIACSKGDTELIASGSFDLLVLHLEDAKTFQSCSVSGTFKLQSTGDGKGSSWFTKSTLQRYLQTFLVLLFLLFITMTKF